ncbi:hypothetical protein [Herbiconiux flava]|uniref:Uncharacterized protein n=1 Tax=Herbiconiux flava TaxID=881268 RepID=A0A852SMX8_9MICO|nr:hypothetical protein [Herbiconiux flava]NYD70169.1 hypothetical protein [Herbiconiux flava]GLK16921.1 hypothetical protein GCM10017602_14030 [Herbiconiux flava]
MLYLARGIEDRSFWVVQEFDGTLVETPWRIEWERNGYRLSHADSNDVSQLVAELGLFDSPEQAVERLRAVLG